METVDLYIFLNHIYYLHQCFISHLCSCMLLSPGAIIHCVKQRRDHISHDITSHIKIVVYYSMHICKHMLSKFCMLFIDSLTKWLYINSRSCQIKLINNIGWWITKVLTTSRNFIVFIVLFLVLLLLTVTDQIEFVKWFFSGIARYVLDMWLFLCVWFCVLQQHRKNRNIIQKLTQQHKISCQEQHQSWSVLWRALQNQFYYLHKALSPSRW